ncbi:T3SS effector HopA1 family protein [Erwinia mallotivora]|uniref:T3SS effector HopA1 family protein n=1 Tax=Erwinia mallotivora TaxID=69222 RepID=UPI0035E8EBA0
MQPIIPRFSNIQQLQSSSVDVKKLLDHGSLEVNGKTYHISAAEGSKINVELATKAKSFFNAVENMLFSSGESKAIAQILESKPRLVRSNALHMYDKGDLTAGPSGHAGRAESSKESSKMPTDNSQQQLQKWAKQAHKMSHPNERDIYKLYKSDKPNLPKVKPEEGQAMLRRSVQLSNVDGVDVFPQKTGAMPKDQMKLYLHNSPLAKGDFIMFRRNNVTDNDPHVSRITLSVHPEHAGELPEMLHGLIRDKDYLHSAKIAHPSFFGQDTDSVILYLNGHLGEALNLADEIQKKLPRDAMVNHNPPGMYRISKGFSYAESSEHDVSSYGMSRAMIIESAVTDKTQGNFEKRLDFQLAAKGYDPKHPAFITNSPSLDIIK